MKVAASIATLLVVFLQSNGCEDSPKPATPVVKQKQLPPLHRFVNVNNTSPGIALDTVTGQYCRTWDWSYKATAMNGGLDTVPTCLYLFNSTQASPLGSPDSSPE